MTKNKLRVLYPQLADKLIVAVQGRLAENLRCLPGYKRCKQIFVEPSLLLRQVRVNALVDGKELIMPSPALKEGFYLLKPYQIPFDKLLIAVTYKGVNRYGSLLDFEDLASLAVSILVCDSLAIDMQGNRLGDGMGFFDLAAAILMELGGVSVDYRTICAVGEQSRVIDGIYRDRWDVSCDIVLTPEKLIELDDSSSDLRIFWDALPAGRIKKISSLWKMRNSGGVNIPVAEK